MSNASNQLADGGHLFALQKLLLRSAEIIVRLAGFLIEPDLFNRGRKLAADCDQQTFVVAGIVTRFAAPDTHQSNRIVFSPKYDPDRGASTSGRLTQEF